MSRKDDIFRSFISNSLITEKYGIDPKDMPENLSQGLQSEYPIINAIALIVKNMESINSISDKALYGQITQYLNEKI